MTKFKKLKLNLYGVMALTLVLGVVLVAGGVKAYQSYNSPKVVIENVENYNEAQAPEAPAEELNIGAVSGPSLPNPNGTNNLDVYVASQTMIDASTTLFSIVSPFLKVTSTGAGGEVIVNYDGGIGWTSQTTTVDFANIVITGAATSSFRIDCGASPRLIPLAGVLPLREIVTNTTYIVTSTKGVIENNVTAAQGALINGGTVAKIMLGSDAPYLICVAEEISHDGSSGLTNADNTLTGRIKVRFLNNAR